MNATVVENATHLPVAERFELLDCIWSSIARDLEHEPAPAALLDELERRDAAYEANPASGVSLEQLEQHLFPKP
jgi:putative addiction module component (TIGR02574 family)